MNGFGREDAWHVHVNTLFGLVNRVVVTSIRGSPGSIVAKVCLPIAREVLRSFNRDPEEFAGADVDVDAQARSANSGGER